MDTVTSERDSLLISICFGMKYLFRALAASLLLSGFSLSANASLLAIDNFNNYTAGDNIDTLNGGTGWTGGWNASTATTTQVSSESLTYTLDGFTYGGGNSFLLTGAGNNNAAIRTMTTDTSGQDYYTSFLVKYEGPSGTETGQVDVQHGFTIAALDSSGAYASSDNMVFANGGGRRIEARSGGSNTDVSTILQLQTTYLVVAKFSGWDDINGNYTTTQAWLNPAKTDEFSTDPTITASHTGPGSDQFSGIAMRFLNNTNFGGDYKVYMDDLRIGTTWDSVVIPEPGTYSLIAASIALGAVMLARRRR
ncbi:PEP-CTERM sorting domain-containing protein [Puniceicoccus vermicola]|uniref:PEP-CTERM sorting domain-containing protein n=1 Tax=Puniceicoccus vermicola TaxID=388746 RepID=A0A7X1E537_9BACT|nr:PEP-CTERM sorting domain-containing protein [Puniceicoccus vermicola]MBC2602719.1 PEP-CTERM sorting domain-containing protein [Puniceicoccus vermicola]